MDSVKIKYGEEAEKIPGYLLWQVSKLWQRHLNAALSDLHLSSTQAVILINVPRLNHEQRIVTQMLLSEVTKIDRMTLSQSIRNLERKKLIKRITPPDNKRAYHVELTENGKEMSMEAAKRIIATHKAFFKPLTNDGENFVSVMQSLIKANNIAGDL